MPHVMVTHRIEDFDKWKSVFDDGLDMRKAGGELSYQVFRAHDDANNLVGLFEWDSFENADKFFQRDDLKEKMKEAGVLGQPEIVFVDQV